MARHFRRADNTFAGTWVDGDPVDPTLVEVPSPPTDGRMTWNGSGWDSPPPIVPASITPLQARKVLRSAGLYAAVQAYVATLTEAEQDEWEYAISIERSNPIIIGGALAIGLSEAQVDQLFIQGATL